MVICSEIPFTDRSFFNVNTYNHIPTDLKVYVPDTSLSRYKEAWKNFPYLSRLHPLSEYQEWYSLSGWIYSAMSENDVLVLYRLTLSSGTKILEPFLLFQPYEAFVPCLGGFLLLIIKFLKESPHNKELCCFIFSTIIVSIVEP